MPKAADYRTLLATTIRKKRNAAGLTQERLAEKANLHPNYLGRVERGEEQISLGAVIRIAKALKVSVSDLVVGLEASA